jgi:hypothetical protein
VTTEKFPLCLNFRFHYVGDVQLGDDARVSRTPRHRISHIDSKRTSIIGLINGGTAGLIWMFLVAWTGFLAVNTSMAEMASMYVHYQPVVVF